MRERKHRIWKPEEKRFYYSDDNCFNSFYEFWEQPAYCCEYEVEDWTGLKDSTGKEIYEGDMIRIGTIKTLFPVRFLQHKFVMQISPGCGYVEFPILVGTKQGDYTIVGNIHEDADLLKGAD